MSPGTKQVELPCRDWEGTTVGVCNGTNAAFTLTYRPSSNIGLQVYLNGLHQREGADYLFSGQIVTFLRPPNHGDTVDFSYSGTFTV